MPRGHIPGRFHSYFPTDFKGHIPTQPPTSFWMSGQDVDPIVPILTELAFLGGFLYLNQMSSPPSSPSAASQVEWNLTDNVINRLRQAFSAPAESANLSTSPMADLSSVSEAFAGNGLEPMVLSSVATVGPTLLEAMKQTVIIANNVEMGILDYAQYTKLYDTQDSTPIESQKPIDQEITNILQKHANDIKRVQENVIEEDLTPVETVLDGNGYMIYSSPSEGAPTVSYTPPIIGELSQSDSDIALRLHNEMAQQASTTSTAQIPSVEDIQKKIDQAQDNQVTKQAIVNFRFLLPTLSFALTSGSDCAEVKTWKSDKLSTEWFTDPIQTLHNHVYKKLPLSVRLALYVYRSSTQLKYGWTALKWMWWLGKKTLV